MNYPEGAVQRFVGALPTTTQKLLDGVIASETYRFAKENVAQQLETSPLLERRFLSAIRGFLFEELAFIFLSRRLSSNLVLTPKQTFEVYYLLHPDKERISFENKLQEGISESYVPDGLIWAVKRRGNQKYIRLVGIAEYMLGGVNYPQRQRKLTTLQTWLKEDITPLVTGESSETIVISDYLRTHDHTLPHVRVSSSRSIRETFVIPSDIRMPVPEQEARALHVPISTPGFHRFVELSIIEVRSQVENGSPTKPQ